MATQPDVQPEPDREALRRWRRERRLPCGAPLRQPRDRRPVSAGSTFKMVTAAAALDTGTLHAELALLRSGLLRSSTASRSQRRQPGGAGDVRTASTSIDRRSSTRSTRSSATSARRSAPEPCSTTRSASASTRCRRSRRRRASASRAGSTTTGRLFDPKQPDTQVDPGRLAFGQERLLRDAAADGDGRRGDRATTASIMQPLRRRARRRAERQDDHAHRSPTELGAADQPADGRPSSRA